MMAQMEGAVTSRFDRVLYFPSISLPARKWTTQTLLYWDKVASIVPHDHVVAPERLPSYMRKLVQNELVEMVEPEDFQDDFYEENLAFLDFLNQSGRSGKLDRMSAAWRRRLNSMPGRYSRAIPASLVHRGKMPMIGDHLVERGLAIQNHEWYEMEPGLARLFMAYLATCIGRRLNYVPITDAPSFINFSQSGGFAGLACEDVKAAARDMLLENLLPVPEEKISVEDIHWFKERHGAELTSFRNHIEQFLIDLSAVPPNERDERVARFMVQALDERGAILELMRKRGIQAIGMGNFCAIASAAINLSLGGSGVLSAVAGGLALAGALASLYERVPRYREEPLAYCAFFGKRYGGIRHGNR